MITPPGTEMPSEHGASVVAGEKGEVVPVVASSNSAVRRQGSCSIAAVTHPAPVLTAVEVGEYSARCRKRKKSEGDDGRHILTGDNAEVKIGGVEKQTSSLARVGDPSPRMTAKNPVETVMPLRQKKRRRADSPAVATGCVVQGSDDAHEREDSQRRLFDAAFFEVSGRSSSVCTVGLGTRPPPSADIVFSLEEQLTTGSSIL